ncbi:TPM domain-containing protein [Cohnella caldifontis]|uniref:TPM domain-containing protein n=1 Tax=Cohnella caldifontis TaxID=3027471 RepID=UPI0023EC1F3B|nr:TPM domain-containing protein [Cohnella sp. YIM B05605]
MAFRRLKSLAAAGLAALLLLLATGGIAWAAQADPRYGVYVQDDAGILSPETRDQLYGQAVWLHDQTGTAQVGVVTVEDLGGSTLEEYAVQRFRQMGLGSKERNDGVLLLYENQEHHVRIEVGYGMEGRIPDGKAGAILDQYFVPNRDSGQLDAAFFQTQSALIIEMAAEYGIDASSVIGSGNLPPLQSGQSDEEGFWSSLPWPAKVIGGAVIILLIFLDFKFTGGAVTYGILNMLLRSRGSSSGGGGRGGWGGGRGGGGSSGGGGASR